MTIRQVRVCDSKYCDRLAVTTCFVCGLDFCDAHIEKFWPVAQPYPWLHYTNFLHVCRTCETAFHNRLMILTLNTSFTSAFQSMLREHMAALDTVLSTAPTATNKDGDRLVYTASRYGQLLVDLFKAEPGFFDDMARYLAIATSDMSAADVGALLETKGVDGLRSLLQRQ